MIEGLKRLRVELREERGQRRAEKRRKKVRTHPAVLVLAEQRLADLGQHLCSIEISRMKREREKQLQTDLLLQQPQPLIQGVVDGDPRSISLDDDTSGAVQPCQSA